MPAHVKRSETSQRPRTSLVSRSGVSCTNVFVSQRPQCDFLTILQQDQQPACTGYTPLGNSDKHNSNGVICTTAMANLCDLTAEAKPSTGRSKQPILRSPFKRNIYLEKWKYRTGKDTLKKLLYDSINNTPVKPNRESERVLRT